MLKTHLGTVEKPINSHRFSVLTRVFLSNSAAQSPSRANVAAKRPQPDPSSNMSMSLGIVVNS